VVVIEDRPRPDEEEALGDQSGDARVHQILVDELGEELGELMAQARRIQERFDARQRPDEGLRERKRRLTRQRISDVATTLFITRGFDKVTVSEVAALAGVSEKTVYNYFPTKESMVLDTQDEIVERLVRDLREHAPGEPLTSAAVRTLKADMQRLDEIPDQLQSLLPMFADMLMATPALRAAWLDLHNRLVAVAAEELAKQAEIDPHDPEAMIAARALVGLGQVAFESRVRYVRQGLRGDALRDAVSTDLDRAARLLETGLWSFNMLAHGRRKTQQLRDAAQAAEEARKQVIKALRQARAAWKALREEG
jgi:AcrR family transcriptional regulator